MAETEFILKVEDCVAGMRRLPEKSIDVVVTSPPYNLGIKYSKYKDSLTSDAYLRWTLEWTTELERVLKDAGSFFLNLGASPANPLFPHEMVVSLSRLFVLQNTFHWIKSITVDTRAGQQISVGHFKPIRSKRFVNDCHEYVFHLTRSGAVPVDRLGLGVSYQDKSNIARWGHTKGRDLRCRGNNWFVPYQTITYRAKDRPHPATFPVQLAANCLKIHGLRPDLVMLDPFVGIGHAAVAAKECGVATFYGFDIDPEYLEVAKKVVKNQSSDVPEQAQSGAAKRKSPRSADATVTPEVRQDSASPSEPPRKRGRPRKPKLADGQASLFTPDLLA